MHTSHSPSCLDSQSLSRFPLVTSVVQTLQLKSLVLTKEALKIVQSSSYVSTGRG